MRRLSAKARGDARGALQLHSRLNCFFSALPAERRASRATRTGCWWLRWISICAARRATAPQPPFYGATIHSLRAATPPSVPALQVKDKWGFQLTARYPMYRDLLVRYTDPGFKPQIVRDPALGP